ncbi:MAG: HD domain-containing protein [Thermoguttaceae bacterium]|nr:HD domain-containing protein [Thermoguttaceae bacterium]
MNVDNVNLTYDAVHGYIPFTSSDNLSPGETSERMLIDNPWVQRLRQIHQLQTAWWVFPTAEHTRFQHVLGAMHLASRTVNWLYDSLVEAIDKLGLSDSQPVPSIGYVEALARVAGLLHDVGHGPFGHFFDRHFLRDYEFNGQRLNHEVLGGIIIQTQLADAIRGIRRTPTHSLEPGEQLDPEYVAFLIKRPVDGEDKNRPQWLIFLRSLFCGLYTVDNMDFVLRDAFMSGLNQKSIDLDRLLYYTFFSEKGLTINEKGMSAVVQFINARAELFKTVYFHRTVRAIDLELGDFFAECKQYLFPGNPAENLDEYLHFTEFSIMSLVDSWRKSDNEFLRRQYEHWSRMSSRQLEWQLACSHSVAFQDGEEKMNIASDEEIFEMRFRKELPEELKQLNLRFDSARHVCRPDALEPSRQQNFVYDPVTNKILQLDTEDLYRQMPQSLRICRVFAHDKEHAAELGRAMNRVFDIHNTEDDDTNM